MRRSVWLASLLTLTMTLTVVMSVAAQVDWRAYDGTTIRFLANKHPWTDYIQTKLPEFQALTGIRVEMEVFPEDQFRTKRLIELTGGSDALDGFMIMPGQVGKQYSLAGWLEPLDGYLSDPSRTEATWDVGDFFEGAMRSGQFDGVQTSIPIQIETSLIAYRTDLFEQYGVAVPTTMEELEEAAAALTLDTNGDGTTDIYGITMRGKRAAATSQWVEFLYSFGGTWLDEQGRAATAAPESVAALEFYGRLLREYGPPGPANLHWYESTSLFQQGKAAMIFDANVFKGLYDDPTASTVVGNVGWAIIPAGPAGAVPHVSTWDLAISSLSRKKDATWLFIQWASNQEHQLGTLLAGVPAARASAWRDPRYTSQETATDWIDASMKAYEIGNPVWNPPVVAVAEVRDAIGLAIVAGINGENVQEAAEQAARETDEIIARTEAQTRR